jgi:hypothetical protein
VTFGLLKFALGIGAPSSSDKQSRDLTATALHYPGRQVAVAIVGIVVACGGLVVAYRALKCKFLKHLRPGGTSAGARKVVERLGQIGVVARGAVLCTVGIVLLVVAVNRQPGKAKGIDTAQRALAHTPFGPWLLVVVALGLVTFGDYSFCEARWREV